ncbi:MAG TPA: hypothetical protein GXX36_09545, partial [Clostridiaceae bacterium]|nr:hypothetical protein [Clostridiaceae bacterium]
MKISRRVLAFICLLSLIFCIYLPANVYAATVTTTGCFQSYETNLANRQLTIRMKALSGSFTINNAGGSAGTYTV